MTLSSVRFGLHVADGIPAIRPGVDGRAGQSDERGLHPDRVLPPLGNAR